VFRLLARTGQDELKLNIVRTIGVLAGVLGVVGGNRVKGVRGKSLSLQRIDSRAKCPTPLLQYSSRTEVLFLMENRGRTEYDGDAKKAHAGATGRTEDLTDAYINEDGFAQEFSSDLPRMAASSAPSDSPPFALSQTPSPASKVNNDGKCDVSHGSVGETKKLEHAPPGEPMPPPGSRMVDSLERPPVVFLASNHDIAPGSFPMRSTHNAAMSRTFRSPIISHDTTRQFTNEEFKLEDGVPNSAGAYTGAHDSSRVATESSMYAVEAQRVPDGNEEATIMVAEAEYVRTKWYQRRWISLGSILLACALVVVVVVLVVRPQSAASSSSSLTSPTTVPITAAPISPDPTTAPSTAVPIMGAPVSTPPSSPISGASPTTVPMTKEPTNPDPSAAPPTLKPITAPPTRAPSTRKPTTSSKPTSLTPERIACNFLSIRNATTCRSNFEFYATTTGSTIPSEIGLLTLLTVLSFSDNSLTSTIPTEIGLLTKLEWFDSESNELTSTIPTEIGLLTHLTLLSFFNNSLTSTIPTEIGLLPQLTELYFSSNQLTSTIPSEIGLLTQLRVLSFSANWLTSTIPTEIGILSQLMELYVSSNQFTSTIPSEIGLLTKLRVLSFSTNSLTSTIPSEIGLLSRLAFLYFSVNGLKGTIPSSLCSLPSLRIGIDCGEIACALGCCFDAVTGFSCG
jgi:hypothetical protein